MSEPLKARSALRMRAVMSLLALPIAMVAGVAFVVAAPGSGDRRTPYVVAAVICFIVVVVAAIDLAVISRRLRQQRQRGG